MSTIPELPPLPRRIPAVPPLPVQPVAPPTQRAPTAYAYPPEDEMLPAMEYAYPYDPPPIPREREQTRIPVDNPFKKTFPGAEFCSVTGEDTLSHLCGAWEDAHMRHQIIAVPGDYAPEPPEHLFGFTRYIQCRDAGYWVKVTE